MLETYEVDSILSLMVAKVDGKHAYYRWVKLQSIIGVYLD